MEGIMSNNNNKQDLKVKAKIAFKKLEEINNEKDSIITELDETFTKLNNLIKKKKSKMFLIETELKLKELLKEFGSVKMGLKFILISQFLLRKVMLRMMFLEP